MLGYLFQLALVFCFSETLAQTSLKESWVAFTKEDGSKAKDKLIVSETEQYIKTTGDSDTVIDFKRSLLILRSKDGQSECLVSTFNRTLFPTPSTMLPLMQTDEVNESYDVPRKRLSFVLTSAETNPSALSKEAQDMCRGHKIYWIVPSMHDSYWKGTRQKRDEEDVTVKERAITINLIFIKIEIRWTKITYPK